MMIAANQPHFVEVDLSEAKVRHLVTPEMIKETGMAATRVAPEFSAIDSEGKAVKLAGKGAKLPQFVYFVLDGCPCSYDAEPLFHKLFKRYKGKVDFVSITNGNVKQAHEWSVQMLVNYPVIPDPTKKIIHAYKAKSSVYSALISREGTIFKMWPGYSADILREINARMAGAAGVKEMPFDPEYAPKTKATGCSF